MLKTVRTGKLARIVHLKHVSNEAGNHVFALLGGDCPTGSIKYYSVLGMLGEMARKGRLVGCTDLFGSSSGNMALAANDLCLQLGMQFHAVIDSRIASGKRDQLIESGVDIINVTVPDPVSGYLGARISRVKELVAGREGADALDQYSNPGALLAHSQITGPWIWRSLQGNVDAFVAALGTGGTFGGTARYLLRCNPSLRSVAVDCRGSVLIYGRQEPHLLTGIGAALVSSNVRLAYEAIRGAAPRVVDDQTAFRRARWLRQVEGIGTGGSGGAVIEAAIGLKREITDKNIVVILPDGERDYMCSVHNSEWMREQCMFEEFGHEDQTFLTGTGIYAIPR